MTEKDGIEKSGIRLKTSAGRMEVTDPEKLRELAKFFELSPEARREIQEMEASQRGALARLRHVVMD